MASPSQPPYRNWKSNSIKDSPLASLPSCPVHLSLGAGSNTPRHRQAASTMTRGPGQPSTSGPHSCRVLASAIVVCIGINKSIFPPHFSFLSFKVHCALYNLKINAVESMKFINLHHISIKYCHLSCDSLIHRCQGTHSGPAPCHLASMPRARKAKKYEVNALVTGATEPCSSGPHLSAPLSPAGHPQSYLSLVCTHCKGTPEATGLTVGCSQ